MITVADFQKAAELIEASGNILVTTHTRPDGDACGSVVALSQVLAALGRNVTPVLLCEIPEWYEFLFDEKPAILGRDISIERLKDPAAPFDLAVILDTNSLAQLPGMGDYLRQFDRPILVADHHVTSDGLGTLELLDTSAAATGLIILDLIRQAGWPLTKKIAQALFVAVATDTGWFRFKNTDSRTLKSCAQLIDAGADPTRTYRRIYENFSDSRFRLMTAMLSSLELHFDGRLAVQTLRRSDFESSAASYGDTENLIDECRRIATVQAAALFVETEDGRVRCSLRSTGPIDVRKIAQKFGGGGHTAAAGAHLSGPIENAKKLILKEFARQFARHLSKPPIDP